MTNENIFKLRNNLKQGNYLHAYEMLINTFEVNPTDKSLAELSKELLIFVQNRAMDLGYNKATEMSREAQEADVLYRLVKLLITKI